jgi:hypothetical protein
LRRRTIYHSTPQVLGVDLTYSKLKLSSSIHIPVGDDAHMVLHLRGIIYYGQAHFTCRLIQADNNVWYNDGIVHGRRCVAEGHVNLIADLNRSQDGRQACFAIYSSC